MYKTIEIVRFIYDGIEYVAEIEVERHTEKTTVLTGGEDRSYYTNIIDEAIVLSIKDGEQEVNRTTKLCDLALREIE